MAKQRFAVIGLLLALVILGATIIQAQSAASGSFTGTIDVFSDSVVLVSGVAFSRSGADIDPDLVLANGSALTVSFTLNGGAFAATRLALPDTAVRGVGKVSGAVELVNGSTVIVGGLAFNTAGADIASDSVFKIGELVDIEFSVSGGAFVVSEIALYDQQRGIIVGTVDAMQMPQITVGGVTFDASEASIDDTEHALALNALVKLEFGIEPDGIVRAYAIQVKIPANVTARSDDYLNVIVAGVVEDLSPNSITIAGVTVDTTDTRVDNEVAVGFPARITFRRSDDTSSTLTPIRVRPLDDLDDLDEVIENNYGDDDDGDGDSTDDSGDDTACALPDGWTTYTVRRGDTLGRIASAANSSTGDLVTANCLSSASLIFVGQVLFVPRSINSGPGSSDDNGSTDDSDNDDNGGSDDDGTDDQGGGNNDDSGGSDDDGSDDQGGGSDDSDDDDDDDGDDD